MLFDLSVWVISIAFVILSIGIVYNIAHLLRSCQLANVSLLVA